MGYLGPGRSLHHRRPWACTPWPTAPPAAWSGRSSHPADAAVTTSALRRTSPLIYLADSRDLVIVASKGGFGAHPPAFRANPDTRVQVGSQILPVHARVATADERRRLWPLLVDLYPTTTPTSAAPTAIRRSDAGAAPGLGASRRRPRAPRPGPEHHEALVTAAPSAHSRCAPEEADACPCRVTTEAKKSRTNTSKTWSTTSRCVRSSSCACSRMHYP